VEANEVCIELGGWSLRLIFIERRLLSRELVEKIYYS